MPQQLMTDLYVSYAEYGRYVVWDYMGENIVWTCVDFVADLCADLWNVYGECENYAVMKGHTGAIMELQYSPDGRLVPIGENGDWLQAP